MEKVRQLGGGLVTAAVALAVLAWFLTAVAHLDTGRRDEGRQQLEDAIRRSAVACYAAEGIYPPDLAYLEEHYGIQVDEARYTVCLLYTSPSPRDQVLSRMPSSA